VFFDELRVRRLVLVGYKQCASGGIRTSFLKASSFVRRIISCSAEAVFGSFNSTALPFPLSLRNCQSNK
jgi:hypothetical protein